MTKAELIRRDNEVRRRLHAFLLAEGFGRVNAVEGASHDYRSAGTYRVPVLQSPTTPRAFAAGDRVIVDTANLRVGAGAPAPLERRRFGCARIEADPRAPTSTRCAPAARRSRPACADPCSSAGSGGQPNHLFFAAYRYIVKEGEDYENAPLPAGVTRRTRRRRTRGDPRHRHLARRRRRASSAPTRRQPIPTTTTCCEPIAASPVPRLRRRARHVRGRHRPPAGARGEGRHHPRPRFERRRPRERHRQGLRPRPGGGGRRRGLRLRRLLLRRRATEGDGGRPRAARARGRS